MNTEEKIAVMQAFVDGQKIEAKSFIAKEDEWIAFDYRVKSDTPDSIDWSHVAPEYKWMARDKDGRGWLFDDKPETSVTLGFWYSKQQYSEAASFASYKRGTVDWQESLVERPE